MGRYKRWCSYPCDGLTEVSVSLANTSVDLEMQHDRYSMNEHEKFNRIKVIDAQQLRSPETVSFRRGCTRKIDTYYEHDQPSNA